MKEVDCVVYGASFIFIQRGFLLIRDIAVNNIEKSIKEFLFKKINNYRSRIIGKLVKKYGCREWLWG